MSKRLPPSPLPPLARFLAHGRGGRAELAAIVALYAVYELVRGFGSDSLRLARANADAIVAFERELGVFVELAIQDFAADVPWLPTLAGAFYAISHLGMTSAALVWLHRRHPSHFALARTTLLVSTTLALVVYVLYPTAPPRLAGLGFTDTVSARTGLDLNSDLLGSLYNPFAAVPSLHFGYALVVGAAVAALARRQWMRAAGAAYPAAMLFVIVATGNHFLLDAAAGAAVTAAGLGAAVLAARTGSHGDPPPPRNGRCPRWQHAHCCG